MCLVFIGLDAHPRHRVVVAANRDEFRARPARPAAPWPGAPHVVAGVDETAGGTWLGATTDGRWAVLTNVRAQDVASGPRPDARSRGALVAGFLTGTVQPEAAAAEAFARRDTYRGFNLVVGDGAEAWIASTRLDAPRALGAGVYGLSNDTLDTPWPKLVRGRDAFAAALARDADDDAYLALLRDTTRPPDAELPETGVGLQKERFLSTAFIDGPDYGTRVSTLLTVGDGVRLRERTWARGARPARDVSWRSSGAGWRQR